MNEHITVGDIFDLSGAGVRFDGAIQGHPLWVPGWAEIIEVNSSVRYGKPYRIRQKGPAIRYSMLNGHYRDCKGGALGDFLKLADGGSAQALDFVLKWGPPSIGSALNRHHLRGISPDDDGRIPRLFQSLDVLQALGPEQDENDPYEVTVFEMLKDMFQIAHQFRAILMAAYELQRGVRPPDLLLAQALGVRNPLQFRWSDLIMTLDERLVASHSPMRVKPTEYEDREEARMAALGDVRTVLGMEISRLTIIGQAYPVLIWNQDFPYLTLSGSSRSATTFGHLHLWEGFCFYQKRTYHDPAWDILDAVSETGNSGYLFRLLILELLSVLKTSLYCCDNCQGLFPLDGKPLPRKPRPDRGVYCSGWCSTQKHREMDRASYARRTVKQKKAGATE